MGDVMVHSIHAQFERQAAKTPNRVALIHEERGITYRELNDRANRLARFMLSRVRRPALTIGTCIERSPDAIATLLAVLKTGGCYMALDPAQPPVRHRQALQQSGATLLVVGGHTTEYQDCGCDLISLVGDKANIERESPANTGVSFGLDRPVSIMFTSGSTDNPKGVILSERWLSHRLSCIWESYPFKSGDRALLHRTPVVVGFLSDCLAPLLAGIPGLLIAQAEAGNPVEVWKRAVGARVSHVAASPSWWETMVVQAEHNAEVWSSLRLGIMSGEEPSLDLVRRWQSVFPGAGLVNRYGSTEAGVIAECDISAEVLNASRVPAGRPARDAEVYILDDDLSLTGEGEAGEIGVAGVGVSQGYTNLPALSAERFVPNPHAPDVANVLVRTGDLGRWRKDGLLEVIGRKDHQLKIRGFRVEPRDVERMLCEHVDVREALVVAREVRPGDRRLVAYCVATTEDSALSQTLRTLVRSRAPDYMVPWAIIIVAAIPRTSQGKVEWRSLPAAEEAVYQSTGDYVNEDSVVAIKLASICSDVLDVRVEGRGHCSFLAVGGDSFLAAQVISRVRSAFDVELPIRSLLDERTLTEVARCIEALLVRDDARVDA